MLNSTVLGGVEWKSMLNPFAEEFFVNKSPSSQSRISIDIDKESPLKSAKPTNTKLSIVENFRLSRQ